MLRFIIRRIIIIVPMLFIVVSLTWMLVRLAPGNFYSGEKKLAPAIENNLREKYGLNKPWHVQYRRVLWNIARFDFGTSLKYEGQTVNQILWRALPVSAALGLSAYVIALLVGITLGTFAALRQNSWIDYGSMAIAMLGISIRTLCSGRFGLAVFAHAVLVSARVVGRVSQSKYCAAGANAVGDLHCLHCAADAFGNAGGFAL